MKTFNLSGEFKLGSEMRKFSKEITANNEDHAKDLVLSHFGSKHKVPRRFINLLTVSELKENIVLQNDSKKSNK
jgi:ribosomal protein L20A (L18A)